LENWKVPMLKSTLGNSYIFLKLTRHIPIVVIIVSRLCITLNVSYNSRWKIFTFHQKVCYHYNHNRRAHPVMFTRRHQNHQGRKQPKVETQRESRSDASTQIILEYKTFLHPLFTGSAGWNSKWASRMLFHKL